MSDVLDVELHDDELMAEIEMVGELMVAASACTEPLDQRAIDDILGVVGILPWIPSQSR